MTCTCGKPVTKRSRSGLCAACVCRLPEVRAKKGKLTEDQRKRRSEQAKALSADPAITAKRDAARAITIRDPAFRVRFAAACAAGKARVKADPVKMEKMREGGRRTHYIPCD